MKTTSMRYIWRSDRWVKPFFKRYRNVLAAALVLGLAAFLFAGALMFTSGYLISGAAAIPESVLALIIPLILVRIFGFGKPVLHYLERLISHDWVLRMTSGLRAALYRSLEKDALFFRATHRTGDILGLLAEDIGHIQNLYLRTVFPTAIAWLLAVVLVAASGFFSLFLAGGLLLSLGVVVFLVPLVSVLVNGARRTRYKELRSRLYAELTDNILGVSDWVFAQRGNEYLQRYRESEHAMKQIARAESRFDRRRDIVVQAVFALTAILLLVWAGAVYGGGDANAANWIAAVVLGFFPLIEAFSPLPSAAVDAFAYSDSVARLNALPFVAEEEPSSESCAPQEPFDLDVDEVSYRYPHAQRQVLEGLSLKIAHGQRVAVLGRSGAGKSTLATLIRGDIMPDQGSVTLGGASTNRLGEAASRFIGVIQQRTYLFNITILENLRLGRADAHEDEVWDVLSQVGLREMVERLPAGLHTMVDEAGMRFSGGERHRIALARVLLQDVPLVILDEPCVGLDPLTERALLETVFAALEGKTIIMITHHLAGVSLMDRVVFVENGRVELDGAPSELAQTSERYRTLMAFDRGIDLAEAR